MVFLLEETLFFQMCKILEMISIFQVTFNNCIGLQHLLYFAIDPMHFLNFIFTQSFHNFALL